MEIPREIRGQLRILRTPAQIQDFLNSLPFNFEKQGETHRSVAETLKAGEAHCLEGAFVAAAAFVMQGQKPFILDLKTVRPDFDHVVTLFQKDKHWGAVSKTNHAVLRYREPVYRTIRELVMSYFHEYYLYETGRKTLRSYSKPFDLTKYGDEWLTSTENLAWIAHELDTSPHFNILTTKQIKNLRKADPIERQILDNEEYKP
jgi:hypothetical protein